MYHNLPLIDIYVIRVKHGLDRHVASVEAGGGGGGLYSLFLAANNFFFKINI